MKPSAFSNELGNDFPSCMVQLQMCQISSSNKIDLVLNMLRTHIQQAVITWNHFISTRHMNCFMGNHA